MWQQENKDRAIVNLTLWLALATTPMAVTLLMPTPTQAKPATDNPNFPLPQKLDNGIQLRIDGSSSLLGINQNLKQSFETQFPGTKVEIAINGTDTAMKALLDGKIDIAAIPRELTSSEKNQGLEQIRLQQEKIVPVVGVSNPFNRTLTVKEFAKILQGEITDWSQLGADQGKIRVIDHPTTSAIRSTLLEHSAFKKTDFGKGANVTQISEENITEIIPQLGKDGISYATANQVSQLPNARIVNLEPITTDDSKYPILQSLVYVYKKNPSPGVAGFLGFTTAPPGQSTIQAARVNEATAIASSALQKIGSSTQATSSAGTKSTTTITPSATTSTPDCYTIWNYIKTTTSRFCKQQP